MKKIIFAAFIIAIVLFCSFAFAKDVVTVVYPEDPSQRITFTDEDCPVNVGTEAGVFYGNGDKRQSGCYYIDDAETKVTFIDIRDPNKLKTRVISVKDINAATKRHNSEVNSQDAAILEMYRNGAFQRPPQPLTCNLMNNYMACY